MIIIIKFLFRFFLFFMFSFSAFAKPITLDFSTIDLARFLEATYSQILNKNIVFSPSLTSISKKVTLHVTLDDSKLIDFLNNFISSQGINFTDKDGVLFFDVKQPDLLLPSSLPIPLPAPVLQVDSKKPFVFKVYNPKFLSSFSLCLLVNKVVSGVCTVSSSSVLLFSSDLHLDSIFSLCESLDKPIKSIKITTSFVEYSGGSRDTNSFTALSNLLGGSVSFNNQSSGALSIKGLNLSLLFDAMKSDSRFNQISSPSGFVLEGQPYSLAIGDDVPTVGQVSTSAVSGSSPVQNIVYRQTGIILNATPHLINSDSSNLVHLFLDASSTSFSPTTSGVNNTPTLTRRDIKTQLVVNVGDVVVIGGLKVQKSATFKQSFFSFPISSSSQSDNVDLLLFLTVDVE